MWLAWSQDKKRPIWESAHWRRGEVWREKEPRARDHKEPIASPKIGRTSIRAFHSPLGRQAFQHALQDLIVAFASLDLTDGHGETEPMRRTRAQNWTFAWDPLSVENALQRASRRWSAWRRRPVARTVLFGTLSRSTMMRCPRLYTIPPEQNNRRGWLRQKNPPALVFCEHSSSHVLEFEQGTTMQGGEHRRFGKCIHSYIFYTQLR